LIDIGGGTTDIAIFQDGIIRHSAVIPLGGNIITEDIKEGCAVMRKQAEALKVKFGCALADEAKENEIIAIPGLRGREPREISVKNLSYIIQARVEEIFEHVHYEIKCSGYEKKLIAGIVITGGGAQLKHLSQLVEYVTGMDARVGFPNEHLSQGMVDEVNSPMFATGIGLTLKGFTPEKKRSEKVVNNSTETVKKKRWYESIFATGKKWLEEEDMDDYSK
jgi:cell division protein FtsA